jgi:hypothetical protein
LSVMPSLNLCIELLHLNKIAISMNQYYLNL